MLFSFLKGHTKNEALTLLIDVGSASVGVALVEIKENSAPHIFTTARASISFLEKLTAQDFLRAMNQALEKVLKSVQTKTKTTGIPAHISCSLSSPWFLLKSRHLMISRPNSFEVTIESLDKILNEGILRLKDELKDVLPPDDMQVVEKKIIQTKLNGYKIENPYGQKATRVELTLTVGISSKQVTERIEHTVKNYFHTAVIHFGAFPIVAFNAIRDIFPTEKSFLFLDITGESTDVSLVNNDLLMGTVTFPRGKNFFIREISAQFRMPHETAASVLNMVLGGTLDSKRQEEVEQLLARIQNDWLERFEKALASLASSGTMPRKIFFMADADTASIFTESLGRAKIPHNERSMFEVQYLDQLILGKFVSFDTGVVRDPFLIAEALLLTKVVPQLNK